MWTLNKILDSSITISICYSEFFPKSIVLLTVSSKNNSMPLLLPAGSSAPRAVAFFQNLLLCDSISFFIDFLRRSKRDNAHHLGIFHIGHVEEGEGEGQTFSLVLHTDTRSISQQ